MKDELIGLRNWDWKSGLEKKSASCLVESDFSCRAYKEECLIS